MNLNNFFSEPRVLLGPMAGVSDEVMRSLSIEAGADLTYTEMVSAKALSYHNQRTRDLVHRAPNEEHIAVQIFGHEPDTMAAQSYALAEQLGQSLAYIDINMGCPARKIIKKGDGSALMASPELASEIVSSIKKQTQVPLGVKFRRGFAANEDTASEFARRMEAAGADLCTVHGRTAAQMYTGKASWDTVREVKDAVSIPVVGNGDIISGATACAMLEQTGCDSIMIARAARGNPWLFSEVQAAIHSEDLPDKPSMLERIEMARRHAHLLAQVNEHGLVRMRKHAMWYVAGMPGASVARGRFSSCSTVLDFDTVFNELAEYIQTATE